MISSILLVAGGVLAFISGAAHFDYRASGQPGGVLSPRQAEWVRNVTFLLAIGSTCVGGSLKLGGF